MASRVHVTSATSPQRVDLDPPNSDQIANNMVLLDNQAFLSALTDMYHKSKLAGSVVITLKRYDGRTKPIPRGDASLPEPDEYSCLYRAALRSKKISTIVRADGLAAFQTSFSNVIKSNMDALKKQKKSKAKRKPKATQ